jgi:hypothetical protein
MNNNQIEITSILEEKKNNFNSHPLKIAKQWNLSDPSNLTPNAQVFITPLKKTNINTSLSVYQTINRHQCYIHLNDSTLYINANLTILITEAWSNVGNFSKPGREKGCQAEHPLYTPEISSLMDIFYDQKFPKRCLQITPRKFIHEWILLLLLCC